MSRLVVVAIPVRDEANRIGGCLRALARQSVPADHVVLLLNNCTDGTAEVVKALPRAPHRLHLIECSLDPSSASAGVARGLAMKYAAALIRKGAILTTDADAEVPDNWVEANLASDEAGRGCGLWPGGDRPDRSFAHSRRICTRTMPGRWPMPLCLTKLNRSSFRIPQTPGPGTGRIQAPPLP